MSSKFIIKPEFNFTIEQKILWCFYRLWRACISVLSQGKFICNEKEKRYRRNMMFLFAGHSDKPLKSLISMAHKGNHICLYRFSFIYVMDNLWEDAYICPINVMNRTTKSAIYVMELWLALISAARNVDWRIFTTWILHATQSGTNKK